MRVAVLDDDADQLELVQQTLTTLGHDCHGFRDGRTLLRALRRESFDLLVLDWQLPEVSGIDVLHWARANLTERVPVLFITNRSAEEDVIAGLAAGADDFMVKPIRAGELTARVQALLRRAYHQAPDTEHVFGEYRFDSATSQLSIAGEPVALKQKEFELALFLFENLGRLLSRKHLLEAVWGIDAEVSSRSLDTHVSRLRTKLNLLPQHGYRLAAIYSVGYRLENLRAPSSEEPADDAPAVEDGPAADDAPAADDPA